MESGEVGFATAGEAAFELEEAAGVGGDEGGGIGGEEVSDLAIAELLGGFGLEEIVDSCGAAAERGLGDLSYFEVGDCR